METIALTTHSEDIQGSKGTLLDYHLQRIEYQQSFDLRVAHCNQQNQMNSASVSYDECCIDCRQDNLELLAMPVLH